MVLRRESSPQGSPAQVAVERITLNYREPYDWEAIHAFLAARAIPGLERAGPGFYARTIRSEGGSGTIRVEPSPAGTGLMALVRFSGADRPSILRRIRHLFDNDCDPGVIGARLSTDPLLARLVAARPGLRVPGAWEGFELAVRAVLGQQVSVEAARRLASKLVVAFGEPIPDEAEPGLLHLFPTPEALVEADVALVLNMPRARGAAVRAVAAAVIAEPDLLAVGQPLDESVARLKALRGIGDWTAHYIAMRALRAPDALPAGDIGLLRALDHGSGRPSAAELLVRAEAWRPWRAYAAMHLWVSDPAAIEANRTMR